MALKERTINIPDYESVDPNDIRDAFIKRLDQTKEEIEFFIRELARGDSGEVDRIERAYKRLIYKSAINKGLFDDEPERIALRDLSCLDDKEPTLAEGLVSGALFLCGLCVYDLRDSDLLEAFNGFAYASQFLGMAIGCDRTQAMNDENKRLLQQYAAQIRHAENRLMKEEVIQYYKGNHASFTSKDDAAFQIAEKIVPAKFATVRGWLKGVNPE